MEMSQSGSTDRGMDDGISDISIHGMESSETLFIMVSNVCSSDDSDTLDTASGVSTTSN